MDFLAGSNGAKHPQNEGIIHPPGSRKPLLSRIIDRTGLGRASGIPQSHSDLRTLGFLIDALAERGDRQAVVDLQEEGYESWSYEELALDVRRLAHGLTKAGLNRGEHVMLFAPTGPEWMVASLAIVGAGAVTTPVDLQLGEEVLSRILDHSGAEFVFTTSEQVERLEHLQAMLNPKPILLDVGKEDPRSWRHLLASGEQDAELKWPEPKEVAALFYGSMALVAALHGNGGCEITVIANWLRDRDDRVGCPLFEPFDALDRKQAETR